MKTLKPIHKEEPTINELKAKINALINQSNLQKDEIRQIKAKTRVTGHYSRIS